LTLNIGFEGLFLGSGGLEGFGAGSFGGLKDLGALEVVGFEELILSISGRSNDIFSPVESLVIVTSFNGRIPIGFETSSRVKGFLGLYNLINGVLVIVFLVNI